MRLSRSCMAAALAAGLLVTNVAAAADVFDPYIKVATARAKAEIALRDGAQTFNRDRNSWNDMWQSIEKSYRADIVLLQRARQAEGEKGEQADRAFIKEAETREQAAHAASNALGQAQGARTLAEQKLGEAQHQWNNVANALSQIRGAEDSWKAAKLDLGMLEAAYFAIERRALECRAQAEAAIAEVRPVKAEWDNMLAETEKFVVGRVPAQK
ncbi:MAG TPA: hypothetical protein VM141_00340 [Planctomycetota bacterium]|nr:hypothetical protein [Planctomycetota bacterium]